MSCLKSSAALGHNIKFMFSRSPCVYFWTFTFPVVYHPKDGANMWRNLCRELGRSLGFKGVRVFELHPGGHGLHVHVATPEYYKVSLVRHISNRMGFGRINVKRWHGEDFEQAAQYMGKYLDKSIRSWAGVSLRGMRWWGVFGMEDQIRVKDVWVESTRRAIWDAVDYNLVVYFMNLGKNVGEKSKKFLLTKMRFVNAIYFDKYDSWRVNTGKLCIVENLRNRCFTLFEWPLRMEVVPI